MLKHANSPSVSNNYEHTMPLGEGTNLNPSLGLLNYEYMLPWVRVPT